MEVTVRHPYPISPEVYWQTLYNSRPFIEALYTEGLGGSDLEISAWTSEENGAFSRALSFNPKMQAPSAVKKLLGNAFRCEERGQFDPGLGRWTFQYLSAALGKKVSIDGEQTTRPTAQGCEVISQLRVHASIFGVGRVLEKTIASQFETDMRAQAAFVRRWLTDHGH